MAKQSGAKKGASGGKKPAPLSTEQKRAVRFLAQNGYVHGVRTKNCLIVRTATLFGCTRQTIYNWLKLEPFLKAIEELLEEVDDAAHTGLLTCMRGIPEQGVLPNIASCIAWKKSRNPEQFDEIYRREVAKREFELELFRLKCAHEKEMLELRIKGGLPAEERDLPDFSFEETGPGERRHKDDAVH